MPAAAGLLPACQRRRISEISLTSLGRTRTANRLARTLARQQADAEVSEPLMPVPELIVPTCRTAHHELRPWRKRPGRGAKQGAIIGRHETTWSLLERSISLIKQASNGSKPHSATVGISFASRVTSENLCSAAES
jgi:hypothetical protein